MVSAGSFTFVDATCNHPPRRLAPVGSGGSPSTGRLISRPLAAGNRRSDDRHGQWPFHPVALGFGAARLHFVAVVLVPLTIGVRNEHAVGYPLPALRRAQPRAC